MRVFISHSSKDKQFARRLAIDIEQNGIKTWFDEWELRVGDSLIDGMENGLKQSDYIIAILSPNSIQSKWVREELKSAIVTGIEGSKTTILPALYQDCDIPLFINDKIYADFRQDYSVGLNAILKTLKAKFTILPRDIKLKIEETQPLTRDDLRALRVMISNNDIEISSSIIRHILPYALIFRCNFSFWYEIAHRYFDKITLQHMIQKALPFKDPLFQKALLISLNDNVTEAMEVLYADLGIKSIFSDGHIPFRGIHVYVRFNELLEYLARIPTPTVRSIFTDDILCSYGDYKFFALRYAAITKEPKVLESLLFHYLFELEELVRERIILTLTEQLTDDELSELIYDHFDTIKKHSHFRWRLIQRANILPSKVRIHLISLCLEDEYSDIRTLARESILEHEKSLFIKMGFHI